MQREDLQTKSDKMEQGSSNHDESGTAADDNAKQPENRFPDRLPKDHIKTLELCSFRGKINLITEPEEMDAALDILCQQKVLGFDTETRPTFKRGVQYDVSLLQLSTNNEAFLFRLNYLGLPEKLADLLGNEKILKVGVAIRDDIRALKKLREFQAKGFVELADVGKKLGIVTCGLRNLAAIFLGVRISKKAQLSNWERAEFDEAQCIYAATDAWICLRMFQFLENEECLPEKFIWRTQSEKSVKKKSSNRRFNDPSKK